jgi:hypothetical protein
MNNNINNENNNNQNNNQNNENEKKMAEAQKKSAIPILSVGIFWILCVALFRLRLDSTNLFIMTAVSFAVYHIVKKMFPPKKIEIIMEAKKPAPETKKEPAKPLTPEERDLKDLNERIDLYFIEIKLLNDSIGDGFISSELLGVENALKKIQTQLNDPAQKSRPKKVEQLGQFFDYYMPTTIKILNSYRRIEKQNLTGDNAMETKKRVEESLPFIRKAFEKELDNMFSEEMLDITTDIDVLEAMLAKDGLVEKNSIHNMMRDVKNDIKDDFLN